MPLRADARDILSIIAYLGRWALLVLPIGALVGSACAFFLWALDVATATRFAEPWLLFLLPAGGAAIGLLYRRFGSAVEGGSNLVVDEIHEPGGGIPARMTPLVLIGTIATHLFGGSAGREGTAIQMGGSIASVYSRLFRRRETVDPRMLLMAGVAAGFGGVFGTPLAGAIFALEVLAIGRMSYAAVIPCMIAAVIADRSCVAWGIHHTHYPALLGDAVAASPLALGSWTLLGKIVLAGAAFGLVARLFSELAHGLQHAFKAAIRWPVLRPVVGGIGVIGLVYLVGTRDYLGLGVTSPVPGAVTILSSFDAGGATPWSWLWKVIFTALTLSSGFKGGEVTPLFFIGATLGNTLSSALDTPVGLFAGLGFVAVFAGATNTPLACTIMAAELFGPAHVLHFAIACFVAYLFSGHSGIYLSQRIATPKLDRSTVPPDISLRTVREMRSLDRQRPLRRASSRRSAMHEPSGEPLVKTTRDHAVVGREMGQLRIYMPPGTKGRPGTRWRRMLGSKPLYQDLIAAAKADGILHATAHNSFHGYSGDQAIQADRSDAPNPRLTLYIELIDQRAKLESFCRAHGDLLKGRVMVYKHVEHWDIHDGVMEEHDATPGELDDEASQG
jgi:H+/Cl- antiporter ClcA/PII-like signaling protein